MSSVAPDFLRDVDERAFEMCMEMAEGLIDRMVVDGLTYGDDDLSDAEFIPYYLDLRARGVLEFLPTVDAGLAERMRRQFERAVARGIEVSNA